MSGTAAAPIEVKMQGMESHSAKPQLARKATGTTGVETATGTLYVSKPFRSGTNKKMRAMISFVPRTSHFDTTNANSGVNEFRGFFALFWISLFLLVVQNYVRSFDQHGYPIELAFATMFSRDATTLAISDAVLVLTTGLCVPFAKLIKNGWIRYYYTGIIIQHTLQTIILFSAIAWTFNRHWPWVQSGFFTLHSLVMIMKMHSYMAINGYLSWVHGQYESTLSSLRSEASRVGGWEKAIADAVAERERMNQHSPSTSTTRATTPSMNTPQQLPDGSTQSYINGDLAVALRKRLVATQTETNGTAEENASNNTFVSSLLTPSSSSSSNSQPEVQQTKPKEYYLVDHPDLRISSLANDLVDIDSELTTSGLEAKKVRWPENISLKNFADYQLIPTLVYELEYPRTDCIRPLYLFEKTTATFGTFALLYSITENFILPLVPTREQSFWRSLLDLALPFMVAYLLLFYIIFECICNAFAELSCFADRGFYEDWVWNSTSWDEFARKWNKPVHTFLLRHVYASTMSNYRISRTTAMFITFFLSAAVHELVMAIVTKKFRFYLFMLQIVQIPLITVGRLPIVKRNKTAGNVVFWLGLYAGFPLLCVAYCAY